MLKMTTLKKARVWLCAGVLVMSTGCPSLDVVNPNHPDIDRALASPEDVRSISISSVNSWYLASTYVEPYLMLSNTADGLTANFGNFGMRFNNEQPRIAYENNSAGGDRLVALQPWLLHYGTLGAANDAMRAYAGGIEIPLSPGVFQTAKFRHLAAFSQAASLSNLALIFDKAFIIDETTDLSPTAEPVDFSPWQDVAAAAKVKWDALIDDISGAAFTYDHSDIPLDPGPLTSTRLSKMSNTMAAMLERYKARSTADTPDWSEILRYTANGLDFDLIVIGDATNWWSYINYYGNEQSWTRTDMRLINLLDNSKPAVFTDAHVAPSPSQATTLTAITSADARGNCAGPLTGSSVECGDFRMYSTVIGDRGRGIWMMSPYMHRRYDHHARFSPTGAETPVPYILAAENNLLRAEALIQSGGSLADAAALINVTRVGRGGLTPASGATTAETLLEYIYYERDIELFNTNGMEYFRNRSITPPPGGERAAGAPGFGLQVGTLRHLPVPAQELEFLGLPLYTFGGVGNEMSIVSGAVGRFDPLRTLTVQAVQQRRLMTSSRRF